VFQELASLLGYTIRFSIVLVLIGITPTLITMISILALAANNPLYPELVRSTLFLFTCFPCFFLLS
jgi:hypothetical protein